jgi:hypothetical protein
MAAFHNQIDFAEYNIKRRAIFLLLQSKKVTRLFQFQNLLIAKIMPVEGAKLENSSKMLKNKHL